MIRVKVLNYAVKEDLGHTHDLDQNKFVLFFLHVYLPRSLAKTVLGVEHCRKVLTSAFKHE